MEKVLIITYACYYISTIDGHSGYMKPNSIFLTLKQNEHFDQFKTKIIPLLLEDELLRENGMWSDCDWYFKVDGTLIEEEKKELRKFLLGHLSSICRVKHNRIR